MSHSNATLESRLRGFIESKDFETETDLCRIMRMRGSDKCSGWHNYTTLYSQIMESSRDSISEVFEVGIYHGCSVRGWSDYFPNARITASDVNVDYLVNEGRIESHICDQDNAGSIQDMWLSIGDREFDIMIDDGKHELESNLNFLVNSIQRLRKGGIFIIEDLTDRTTAGLSSLVDKIRLELSLEEAFILDIPNVHNKIDNRIMVMVK